MTWRKKITVDVKGEFLELKDTINTMVDQLRSFASEVTRVAREVGTEGRLGGQAKVEGVSGTWKDLTDGVNSMASNLTSQMRNIAEVTTAVANGDLSKKITVDVRGEILELKSTINTMVDQLNSFASEVTRVAREVGTDGKLGGQANVQGVAGTWKDLTDSVNFMAGNLTAQVRNIVAVTTAVANGDLAKKITVDVKGEILELKNTINTMVGQLGSFASEVTRVAREVGRYTRQVCHHLVRVVEAPPVNIIILPVVFEDQVKAVIELASFQRFNSTHQTFLNQLTESIGIVLNTIEANSLTEDLLKQSQSLTNELQSRQLELQKTNLELEEKATQLVEQNAEVERKNSEVEQARQALEEKAEQLAATSRFKSEFLANMSHELPNSAEQSADFSGSIGG